MKILHLADLHIGKQVNGFPLIEDQRFALEAVLAAARDHSVDALLLAGDLYDKSSPSAEAVCLLDWFFTEVATAGLPCYAIPGNHDSAERVAYVSGLLTRQGIHLAPIFDGRVTHHSLEDEHGPVTFWLLPFMKPAHVRAFFPDADIGQDYTAALRTVLADCPLETSQRNVLIAHQFVTSGTAEPERSDSELSVGGLDNVDASVFADFDYVALGHIHRPQRIGRDEVRYAGSLLKYSFSEIKYPKSATLVELGPKGTISITLLPLEPLHDMREIKGPLASLLADDVVTASKSDDYLHVVLTDEDP
ncbi:MAG: exonuclease SbcCD subunit D, partial [Raoultibacter sp.]